MNTIKKPGCNLMLMILALVMTAAPAVGADTPTAAQSPAADSAAPEVAAEAAPKSKNVAVVNGEAITREHFDREVERATQRFSRQGQPPPPEKDRHLPDDPGQCRYCIGQRHPRSLFEGNRCLSAFPQSRNYHSLDHCLVSNRFSTAIRTKVDQ